MEPAVGSFWTIVIYSEPRLRFIAKGSMPILFIAVQAQEKAICFFSCAWNLFSILSKAHSSQHLKVLGFLGRWIIKERRKEHPVAGCSFYVNSPR